MEKFIVALFYKINPVQITTIVAENTETFIKLGTSHNRNINSDL